MAAPKFRLQFDPAHGQAVDVLPGIQRVTAPNESAFTFRGTNTYILGKDEVAVIDPGPADANHLEHLKRVLDGRKLTHIFVTHTHADHSPLAMPLKEHTGATIYAEGPHRDSRALHLGEVNSLDAAGDREFQPDVRLKHGDIVEGKDWKLETILTPGHAANHACFALLDRDLIFSGDHVMGWSTSIVAPPDGSMADYMSSLDLMTQRTESLYLPGHGGRLEKAREFVRALRAHRKMRETAILSRIRAGDRTIPEVVSVIYRDTDPRLHGAAGLSVFAHLEELVQKGLVHCEGAPGLGSVYEPADRQ
ncbi:MAG: MBL fold metallo-hydrolase [Rhizobiaceae bacterium]|nr:MBL fold metallo-hydrolase [Rhizobiaceae bacterium]